MKNLFRITPLILFISISFNLYGQDHYQSGLDAITEEAVEGQLEFLASDWMEGREPGTNGIEMAADYIASMFKVYGVEPAGDIKMTNVPWSDRRRGIRPEEITTYFQEFSLIEYEPGEEQYLTLISSSDGVQSKINVNYRTDFSVNRATIGMEAETEVVFVGYGFKNEDEGYNDFDDVDVKGKFALRLAGFPGHRDTASAAYKKLAPKGRYARWRLSRNKNSTAQEVGALGIIEISPDNSVEIDWADNFPRRYNNDYYEGTERLSAGVRKYLTLPGDSINRRLTEIKITNRLGHELLKGSNIDLEKFESTVSTSLKPQSTDLKNKRIHLKTTVNSNIVRARNVVGKIEGENPNEIIVIGGHYDHVGANKGYIWNGSDDNASGSVGVMTVAKGMAASGKKPEKTVMFALWSAEESGLLGSEYFVDKYAAIDDVVLYLNFDMISRDDYSDSSGTAVSMDYTSAYPQLESVTDEYNHKLNLGLDIKYEPSPRPRGGSDHSSFSAIDIPVFYYFTGFHPDYHGIGDHADKANIPKMTSIIKLGYSNIWEVASSKDKFMPPPEPAADNEIVEGK